ncbi:MAG TPA: nuclear transport factor 2 family protein [Kofleriaceae bacterium]
MTTFEIGKKLVELCSQGKNDVAIKEPYDQNIVSLEAFPGPDRETKGLDKVLAKSAAWAEAHQIHSAKTEGPFPLDDRFAVTFRYDITRKKDNQRLDMHEVAVFTVKDNKIVREEFFYPTGA